MKKCISIILCIAALLSAVSVVAFASQELRFNAEKKFTVLNFSDIQDIYPMKEITKNYIRDTLNKIQPDLVVLTGDNIYGTYCETKETVEKAIGEYMQIFEEACVPVAAVFGNHDSDKNSNISKAFQMTVYEKYTCFVGKAGFVADNRVGNYNLPIKSSVGSDYVFNLWFFDSGEYNDENKRGGYACVHRNQIEWYERTCEELRSKNGGKNIPSISFQHIVVPEIFDALAKNGNKWSLPEGATGVLGETPCPPKYNNGQFAAFSRQGDVLATVSGHDHTNTYIIKHDGIYLINTPGIGTYSYYSSDFGSRVFVLNENDPRNFETYCVSYFDVYSRDDAAAVERYNILFSNANAEDDSQKQLTFFEKIKIFFQKVLDFFKRLFG